MDDAVAEGFLPPAPRHGACAVCDFREVCGPHEERRSKRKDVERLKDLYEVRTFP